jgi:hypothetical protein
MLVFTFASNVSVQNATVIAGAGSATNFTVLGNEVTVNLTGVTNAQTITVKLTRVGDGTNTSDIAVSMGVLIGDTTENGTVNSSDIGQVQSQSGQPMTQDNFREDVTTNGALNSCDIALVQAQSGTALSVWHAMWTPIQPAKLTPLDVHVSVPNKGQRRPENKRREF